jgi:hypothetical protein
MPNWCENTLEVYGEEEEMDKFYEFFGGTEKFEKNFNFNNIIEMPRILEETTSPVRIISEEDYDKLQELREKYTLELNSSGKNVWDLFNDKKISEEERELMFQNGITQEISDRLKSLYGSDNWYTWANNNWGTKWDIDGDDGIVNDLDTHNCSLTFSTAWSPPEPIINKLRDMFPNLEFSGMYVGEGYEFADVF